MSRLACIHSGFALFSGLPWAIEKLLQFGSSQGSQGASVPVCQPETEEARHEIGKLASATQNTVCAHDLD